MLASHVLVTKAYPAPFPNLRFAIKIRGRTWYPVIRAHKYISRSGMHWNYYYLVSLDKQELEQVLGPVLVYDPEPLINIRNIVDFKELKTFSDCYEEAFEILRQKLPALLSIIRAAYTRPEPPESFLISFSESALVIWGAPGQNVIEAKAEKVAQQGNLHIYKLHHELELDKIYVFKYVSRFEVERHIAFSKRDITIFSVLDSFSSKTFTASLVLIDTDSEHEISIVHPEHEKLKIEVDRGLYVFTHYRNLE